MSVDAYLKIDDIKGESQDNVHKDEIEVLSWGWGMSQPGSAHSGTGAGTGKVAVKNLTIQKCFDKATPNLMKYCCSGKHFGIARLTVRKAGEKPLEFIQIELKDGLIVDVSVVGNPGDSQVRESVTLNFASFKVEYVPQTATGAGGAAIPMQWNVVKNAES